MKGIVWKSACVILLFYTGIGGFLMSTPRLPILNETIRNLYFHVPMWFGMIFLFFMSFFHSIKYLRTNKIDQDTKAIEYGNIGLLFGILGCATGSLWAKFTWGAWWTNDPKLNGAAIGMLIYLAYFVLRGSFSDDQQRARISAVYNIFAFLVLIPLLFILPRLTDSLHPGNGGNPGFNAYDLNSQMRLVFYPAVIAWSLLGYWIAELNIRMHLLSDKISN
jgi:heme exporter protein C